MKYTIALIWAVSFVIAAVGFKVSKADARLFLPLIILGMVGGVTISQIDVLKSFTTPGGWKVETARAQIAEEAEKQIKNITREVNIHKEAISSLIEKAEKSREELNVQKTEISTVIKKADETREDLLRVAEAAAPPHLSLESKDVEQTEEGYQVTLRLSPSKNAPFGTLLFRAEIIGDSEAIVKQLTCEGMHFSGKEQVSTDGKTAIKQYASPGVREEKIILTVSAPCKVRISGTHLREPLEFEVK